MTLQNQTMLVLVMTLSGMPVWAAVPDVQGQSYVAARAGFQTRLVRRGPAPGPTSPADPPPGIRQVRYPSGDLKLAAWVRVPGGARTRRQPAVVFFHGGLALDVEWVELTRPFFDAGFVVMLPMLRGENGNPGAFELLLGEIDDAAAAVRWLAGQPYVDPSRIYAFGHSMGARVSVMLTLQPDVPIRLSGGSAGLYTADGFLRWGSRAPFDVQKVWERRIRAPFDFLDGMRHRHLAFAGRQDYAGERLTEYRRLAQGTRLEIREVDGDHMGCLRPAVAAFLGVIRQAGPPVFLPGPSLGSSWTMDLGLGDLDGDGDLDAFTANYGVPNRVWLNDGGGMFSASGQELGTSASHTVALGDLDGDGDLDAFVGNVEDQPDTVWLNDGQGRFRFSDQRLSSQSTMGAALGDLDSDGNLDVATGRFAAGAEILLNDGRARLRATGQDFGSAFAPGIALGDLDGDGDLDLLTGGWGGTEAAPSNGVWLNDGKARFELVRALDEPGRPAHAVAAGDVDLDGDLDILLGFGGRRAGLSIWRNEGRNRFDRVCELECDGSVHGMVLGDLDGDGDIDLVLAQGSSSDSANTVWINDGRGQFSDTGARLGDALSSGVALGDLDGDGDRDIVTADGDLKAEGRGAANGVWIQQGPGETALKQGDGPN